METSLPASLSTGSPYDPQVVQPELPQPTNATIPPAAIFGFAEKDAIHLLGCSGSSFEKGGATTPVGTSRRDGLGGGRLRGRTYHAAFQLALLLALALFLAFPLALALLLFARTLLSLPPHLLHQVGPLLGQLGAFQRHEVQVAARARVKAAV